MVLGMSVMFGLVVGCPPCRGIIPSPPVRPWLQTKTESGHDYFKGWNHRIGMYDFVSILVDGTRSGCRINASAQFLADNIDFGSRSHQEPCHLYRKAIVVLRMKFHES
jgi:hypothetical protein